jgi:DNA-directed RNA polymerase sigma subunit (sigma70/sigma32)
MSNYPAMLHTPFNFRDSKLSARRETTYEDVLPSLFKLPIDESNGKDLRREMEAMMETNLNSIEKEILKLRLGMEDGVVRPVKEIGKQFKISWKEVRIFEKSAINKLLDSGEISKFVQHYNIVQS